jgi:hypothetical protein
MGRVLRGLAVVQVLSFVLMLVAVYFLTTGWVVALCVGFVGAVLPERIRT